MGKKINKISRLIAKVTDEITITAIIFLGAIVPINDYWELMNRPSGIYLVIDPTISFIVLALIIALIICIRFLLIPEEAQKAYVLRVAFAIIVLTAFDLPILLFGREEYFYYIIVLVIFAFSISMLVLIPDICKKFKRKC